MTFGENDSELTKDIAYFGLHYDNALNLLMVHIYLSIR